MIILPGERGPERTPLEERQGLGTGIGPESERRQDGLYLGLRAVSGEVPRELLARLGESPLQEIHESRVGRRESIYLE